MESSASACWGRFCRAVVSAGRRLAADQRGSAYTLSYVMVLPVVMFFLVLIIESALMITAKNGTTYAAFAAARSAIVWHSVDPAVAQKKAKQAAVLALVPFSNGLLETSSSAGVDKSQENAFAALYRSASKTPMSDGYVRRKFREASRHVTVSIKEGEPRGEPWKRDLTVEVTFDYSFHVPLTARLFGQSNGRMPMKATAVLTLECPQNEKRKLGINYESP